MLHHIDQVHKMVMQDIRAEVEHESELLDKICDVEHAPHEPRFFAIYRRALEIVS